MSIWSRLGRLLQVDDSILSEEFTLLAIRDGEQADDSQDKEDKEGAESEKREESPQADHAEKGQADEAQADEPKHKDSPYVKPKTLKELREERAVASEKKSEQASERASEHADAKHPPEKLYRDLDQNRKYVETLFHLPVNADVIIRDFTVAAADVPYRAFAVFMEGLSDKTIINMNVLEPLMMLGRVTHPPSVGDRITTVKDRLLTGNQVMEYDKWKDVKNNILAGSTVVFLEDMNQALAVETKGWEHRSVSDTKTETVVRGPHDAFTENLRSNTGLVRARLRTEQLITEMISVGEMAPTDVAVMYIEGITNQSLVQEVKRRIKDIKVDFVQDSGLLEQYIEDSPAGFIPRMMATERPDRVAAFLAEGFVAVFVGLSPYVLILPTTIWSLVHTAEDAYLRYPFGSLIRLIRFLALVVALLLPAVYIAVTNYHPEMIPTDLMLTIAAAREKVPFPAVLEVLLMEFSIELIREAGIRIPNVIGPTIGIVGALILGQAAVQAGVISPLLVIIVAVTALASFTLPNYNLSFAIRTLRFLFILTAAMWGFYGITLGVLILLMHWTNIKSVGVPMLAPFSPYSQANSDIVLRGTVFRQEKRLGALRPQQQQRQAPFVRKWNPRVHDSEEARRAGKRKSSLSSLLKAKPGKKSQDGEDSEGGEQDD